MNSPAARGKSLTGLALRSPAACVPMRGIAPPAQRVRREHDRKHTRATRREGDAGSRVPSGTFPSLPVNSFTGRTRAHARNRSSRPRTRNREYDRKHTRRGGHERSRKQVLCGCEVRVAWRPSTSLARVQIPPPAPESAREIPSGFAARASPLVSSFSGTGPPIVDRQTRVRFPSRPPSSPSLTAPSSNRFRMMDLHSNDAGSKPAGAAIRAHIARRRRAASRSTSSSFAKQNRSSVSPTGSR